MYLNEKELCNRIYSCWVGKNIGGTLGTPFEGRRELLDVTDFQSAPGKPLPNDDLDLQLVWLRALEDYGPLGVNEQVLGEYWLNYIPPHWNEYGIGKSNMRAGLLPPLSGDYNNEWKHSNGAWIRSEIWACCAPGCPEIAARYAWMDACVDHGAGKGTYAALFTASVESAAFVEPDRDKLIDIGLSYIPQDCRVAKSIRIALGGYRSGLDWKETRNLVLEDSEDLGWFQAPANIAFFIIGWLYGEGDFKKSLLITVSCGDDTDCTGATLGSILGIIGGADGIPEVWKKHIGDDIISVAIDMGSLSNIPATCAELSQRTLAMCRKVLQANRAAVTISDLPQDISDPDSNKLGPSAKYLAWLSQPDKTLTYRFYHTELKLEYVSGPEIEACGDAELRMTLRNLLPDPRHIDISYMLPDGFELMEGIRHISLPWVHSGDKKVVRIKLCAPNDVQPVNRGVIHMVAQGRPTVMLIPIILFAQ